MLVSLYLLSRQVVDLREVTLAWFWKAVRFGTLVEWTQSCLRRLDPDSSERPENDNGDAGTDTAVAHTATKWV